ncbi:MAG: hypothetical protein GF390_01950 [Candidatus Pacebacteria bacterium]|nr:hypothetical protein [Candidatus Paceibacterota bacterium]
MIEINLTALWERLSAPFIWLVKKVKKWFNKLLGRRARSRYRRTTAAQQRLRTMRILRWTAVLSLIGVVMMIIAFFGMFAWYSRDLPKPGQIVRRQGFSTKIYDRDGALLYDLFESERRNPIDINNAPEHLKQATIAIEDKDFYQHQGFDLLTALRIPYNLVFRKRIVGGSTLTQQLVKNVLLTSERKISRKFKELVLAIQIERTFTKDEILEMYLNEAPYGGTAWGVGTAAEIYFNKPVAELNLVESAFLAGLPQRPSAYSPYTGKQDGNGEPLWKMRTKAVLRRMKEDQYLTQLAYDDAVNQLDSLEFEKTAIEIKAPHFVFYVKDQLAEMYGEDLVERGGLKITTTLDLALHEKAQEIVAAEVAEIEDLDISNGAAVVMDPRTGEILSLVGSRDYFNDDIGGQFNVAVDGLRQPGSSIKPVTYLALMQQGYTPATMLMDVQTNFKPNEQTKDYIPKNYDGKYRGPVSVRNSLGSSLNVPAVKSLSLVGIENFLTLANEMGLASLAPTKENLQRFGYALTLGGGEVTLLDLTTAYSSFATSGIKVEPVAILKVEDQNGQVLFEHKHLQGARVFSEAEAFLINHILSDNSARLIAFGANSLLNTGKPIAVKTGTTNDQRDNWTIGWSQEIIVGAWVGNNDNSPMSYVASGITGASPIWRQIIFAALEAGYQAPDWEIPDSIEQVEVDKVSGYPSHDGFDSKQEYVIKGTLPNPPDPIHTKLKLCKGENKLATEAKIAAGNYEEKEFFVFQVYDPISEDGKNRWQEGVDAWIAAQEDGRYKPPTEYCGEAGDVNVRLVKPENEKIYESEEIEIKVEAGSGEGIEKIEIWVDGSKRETINDHRYEGKLKLAKGRHEVFAKAQSRTGQWSESNHAKIGTGGEDWQEPEPTPTPKPTKTPVTPTPKSSPTPEPTLGV